MPGLEFMNMPAARQKESPFTIVDNQLEELVQTTRQEENYLRRTSMSGQQFASEINQLQRRYDIQRSNILSIKKSMELVKNLVVQGSISQEAGDEAMWKLVLPEDIQRAMFQKPVDLGTPIKLDSPEQERLITSINEYTAPEIIQEGAGSWFRSKKPVQGALLNQYAKFRNEIGYKALSPIVQKQIDDMWDNIQVDRKLENPDWDWDPESREVKIMRPYGPLQEAMSDRISPLARSINSEKPESVLAKVLKGSAKVGVFGPPGQIAYGISKLRSKTPNKGITATNPKTGERVISHDNGKTWSPLR